MARVSAAVPVNRQVSPRCARDSGAVPLPRSPQSRCGSRQPCPVGDTPRGRASCPACLSLTPWSQKVSGTPEAPEAPWGEPSGAEPGGEALGCGCAHRVVIWFFLVPLGGGVSISSSYDGRINPARGCKISIILGLCHYFLRLGSVGKQSMNAVTETASIRRSEHRQTSQSPGGNTARGAPRQGPCCLARGSLPVRWRVNAVRWAGYHLTAAPPHTGRESFSIFCAQKHVLSVDHF